MNKNFSAYLDIIRFSAALMVFLGHASTGYMTGGLFWQLAIYGDTCVIIFFVLSGFVIAYVVDAKDDNWQIYASNRASRLWSVVLPALALTFIIDLFGVRIAPAIYNGPWFTPDDPLLRYAASAMMMQEIWHVWLVPGVNNPFWSLTYEAVYYAIFGVVMFSESRAKWWIVGIMLIASGPVIAALAPVWAFGYVAYRITKRHTLSKVTSAFLFFAGAALLIASPKLRMILNTFDLPVMGQPILGRYFDAVSIFLHLIGAHGLIGSSIKFPSSLRSAISSVAAVTFVLYLFHRPLIQFFTYAGPADQSSWQRRVILIGGTLAICFVALPVCEWLRRYLQHRIFALLTLRKARQLAV